MRANVCVCGPANPAQPSLRGTAARQDARRPGESVAQLRARWTLDNLAAHLAAPCLTQAQDRTDTLHMFVLPHPPAASNIPSRPWVSRPWDARQHSVASLGTRRMRDSPLQCVASLRLWSPDFERRTGCNWQPIHPPFIAFSSVQFSEKTRSTHNTRPQLSVSVYGTVYLGRTIHLTHARPATGR